MNKLHFQKRMLTMSIVMPHDKQTSICTRLAKSYSSYDVVNEIKDQRHNTGPMVPGIYRAAADATGSTSMDGEQRDLLGDAETRAER